MPVIELDRLPLPSLRAYTALSVALLGASVYYAAQTINSAGLKPGQDLDLVSTAITTPNSIRPLLGLIKASGNHVAEIFSFMIHEPLCIWVSEKKMFSLFQQFFFIDFLLFFYVNILFFYQWRYN